MDTYSYISFSWALINLLFFAYKLLVLINPGLIKLIRIFLFDNSNERDFTSPIKADFDEEYITCPGVPFGSEIDEIITMNFKQFLLKLIFLILKW